MSGIKAQDAAAKKTLPPFRILLTSMKYYKAADMDKNVPKMIVYFDPTCDHCRAFTTELLKHENDFGKTQIVMISYTPVVQVKQFETEFKLSKYPNIKLGTEGYTFIVQRYYNVQKFPFTAVYGKKGTMIASYREVPSVNELQNKIKKA